MRGAPTAERRVLPLKTEQFFTSTDKAIPKEWSTPRLEFGWTCALLSPEGGVCVRWCNVVPFQAAGQGISREDSAAQPGAERLQAAFRPRRNSQPSRADGVLLGSGPAPRFSCTWTVRVRRVRVLGGRGQYIWRVAIEGQRGLIGGSMGARAALRGPGRAGEVVRSLGPGDMRIVKMSCESGSAAGEWCPRDNDELSVGARDARDSVGGGQ